MAKANSVITSRYDEAARMLGFIVEGAGELVLDLDSLSDQVKAQAMIHGLKQRISDAAAIARNTETGASATPQEKFTAMQELVEHYNSGAVDWNRIRAKGASEGGLLLRALMLYKPQSDRAAVAEKIKGWTKAQQMALLNSEALRDIVAGIRAEGAKGIDAEELLEAL